MIRYLFYFSILFFMFQVVLPKTKGAMEIERRIIPKRIEKKLIPYKRHILYAERFLEEGDYKNAIMELKKAEKLYNRDPILYEMYAHAYDGLRNGSKAFYFFKKAMRLYLDDKEKKWNRIYRVLGFLRSLCSGPKECNEVGKFEREIKRYRR